jgi:3-deoxy-D-manno-oct-2-ulosonic acid (Kdo) hydroxylase
MSATNNVPTCQPQSVPSEGCSEERLERGEIGYYPVCPFPIPQGDDLRFLLEQRLASRAHKNISYDPRTGRLGGFYRTSQANIERLHCLLADFQRKATAWLASKLPRYAKAWRLDQVSYRPEEEATRKLRLKSRNDLLHVDAFPSRPTNGQRILRLFVNINPSEPRVWCTSMPFKQLLQRYGGEAGLPGCASASWLRQVRRGVVGLFSPKIRNRSPYDQFMLRFHDFLKANDAFQVGGPKQYWSFPPGSTWIVFTDVASHAVLRGRYALEHSYFVAPESLALPDESPPALLERLCGRPVLHAA